MSVIRTKNRIQFAEDFVLNNGKIGIATNDPQQTLDVIGNIGATGLVTASQLSAGLYQGEVRFLDNVFIDGNITIAGTSAVVDTQTLRIQDADIILGFTTNQNGDEVSSDDTANHGGIAIASTEGTPLSRVVVTGIETLPATYKKIMWFKSDTFSGVSTDAWMINYGVSIGNTTNVPTGTRLAAGDVLIGQDDITLVRDINATGIITGNTADFNSYTDLNVTGVSTFQNAVYIKDYSRLKFGLSSDTPDLEIYHGSNRNSYIDNNTKSLVIRNNVDNDGTRGNIIIQAKPGATSASFIDGGGVELYYGDVGVTTYKAFETTGFGATVFGTLETQQLLVTGISTFNDTVAFNPDGVLVGTISSTSQKFGGIVTWPELQSTNSNADLSIPLTFEKVNGAGTGHVSVDSTIQTKTTGKYYIEVTLNDFQFGGWISPGVRNNGTSLNPNSEPINYSQPIGAFGNEYGLLQNTSIDIYIRSNNQELITSGGTEQVGFSAYQTGDIIGILLDLDNNTLAFSQNGSIGNSVPVESGLNYKFAVSHYGEQESITVNFGETPFTYTPPAGYQGLFETSPYVEVEQSGLDFVGVSTFADDVTISGDLNIIGNISAGLDITGDLDLSGNLNVSGISTFNSNVDIKNLSGPKALDIYGLVDTDIFTHPNGDRIGDFDTDSGAQSDEVFNLIQAGNLADVDVAEQRLLVRRTGGPITAAWVTFTTVVGVTYTLSCEVEGVLSNGNPRVSVTDATDGAQPYSGTVLGTADGSANTRVAISYTFTATSTSSSLNLGITDFTRDFYVYDLSIVGPVETNTISFGSSGISTFKDTAVFDSTGSIQIPVGTTAERPGIAVTGQIRYNTENSSFEGYGPGGAWGSLGGVKDVDGDTYILAETSAGSDEDTLYFYTGGELTGTISTTNGITGDGENIRSVYAPKAAAASYASYSETSNSALSIAGLSTYTEVGKFTGSQSGGTDKFGNALAVSADGKTIVVGAVSDELTVGGSGLAYVFDREGNNFNQVGILSALPSNTDANDQFGYSVAISDDGRTISVGAIWDEAPGNADESGVVYVYDRVGNDFNRVGILTGSLASDGNDNFGGSVALNGDGKTLVVGAPADETNTISLPGQGVAYVFDKVGTTYNQVGILTATIGNQDASDKFGMSVQVSSDGNTFAIGAEDDEITGSGNFAHGLVYIFDRNGNSFEQVGILTGTYAQDLFDDFGAIETLALSANGRTIAVGAPADEISGVDGGGIVYVFDRVGDTFSEVGILTGSYVESNELFGDTVAINADGTVIAATARLDELPGGSTTGVVYVYNRQGDQFNEVAAFIGSDISTGNLFGSSLGVSADGKSIIVGAESGGANTGQVYVFDEEKETYVYSDTEGNIGIGSAIPAAKLDVAGNIRVSGTILGANLNNVSIAATFIASPGVAYTMDSYTLATDNLKTAEYTIHIENGTNIQSQKLLVMQNGTTAFSQEYAIMFDSDSLVSIASTLNAGVVSVEITPETGVLGLTTYRYIRQSIS